MRDGARGIGERMQCVNTHPIELPRNAQRLVPNGFFSFEIHMSDRALRATFLQVSPRLGRLAPTDCSACRRNACAAMRCDKGDGRLAGAVGLCRTW